MNQLLAFWLGGACVVAIQVILEPHPPTASRGYFLILGLFVILWPASVFVRARFIQQQHEQRVAEEEEWERIESMREPVLCDVVCPHCGAPPEYPLERSELPVTRVGWLCFRCSRVVFADIK